MRTIRTALLAFWLVLAATVAAHADPITAAITAIATAVSSISVANVIGAILSFAATVASSLLAKAKKGGEVAGVKSAIDVGGDKPLSFVMGRYATAGHLVYVNTRGKANLGKTKVKNAYLTQVISLGDLPGQNFTGLWIYDQKINLAGFATPNDNETGWSVKEFFGKDTHNTLGIRYHDGRQTAPDAYLLDKYGSDEEYPFPADCIGRGVPYIVVTAQYDPSLYSGTPQVMVETDGIPLYDPRKDSSVGGSGAQRWDNPLTWAASSNPIVQIYNILRGIRYEGQWFWGGQTIGAYQLPLSNWMTAMNACDAAIQLAEGGTEPQFRSGLEVTVDQEPMDVIENILKGCNGRMAEIGGIYKVTVGAPGAPVYSFSDFSIVVTEGQQLDPFPGLQDTTNGASAGYPEPAEKWAVKEAPAYYRTDLEGLDDGRRLVAALRYPYVPYANQVQRLLKSALEDARRFRQHRFTLPPEAWALEPLDVVAWSSTRNGYNEKRFLVVEVAGGSNFLQTVSLKEIDPADYSWSPDDQQPYDFGFLGTVRPDTQVLSGWQVAGASIFDATQQRQRPTIKVFYDGGEIDVDDIRVQVRLEGSTDTIFDGTMAYDAPEDRQYATLLNGVFTGNTRYEARGIYRSRSGRSFEWSDWLDATTPAEILGITPDQIAAELREMMAFGRRSFDDLDERVRVLATNLNLITAQAISDIGNATARIFEESTVRASQIEAQARRTTLVSADLTSKISGLVGQADAIQSLTARVDDQNGRLNAQADALTGVTARVGEVDAAGLFKIEARAGASGEVNLVLMGRVTTNQGFREVGLLMRVTSSNALIALAADQVVFGDGATLSGVRSQAALGATDPAARINGGGTVKVAGGRIEADSVDAAVVVKTQTVIADKLVLKGVPTERIADGAVSTISEVFTQGDSAPIVVSIAYGSFVISGYVTYAGSNLDGGRLTRSWNLYRGGTVIQSGVVSNQERCPIALQDDPEPGTYTYRLDIVNAGGNGASRLIFTNNKK